MKTKKRLKHQKNVKNGGLEVKGLISKNKKTYPSTFREVSCVQISPGYLNSKYRLITE